MRGSIQKLCRALTLKSCERGSGLPSQSVWYPTPECRQSCMIQLRGKLLSVDATEIWHLSMP